MMMPLTAAQINCLADRDDPVSRAIVATIRALESERDQLREEIARRNREDDVTERLSAETLAHFLEGDDAASAVTADKGTRIEIARASRRAAEEMREAAAAIADREGGIPSPSLRDAASRRVCHDLASIIRAMPLPFANESCTGLTARWCPIHGDCVCDDMDDLACPLHRTDSDHAEDR